jgi:transposase, IS5 family
MYRRAQKQDMPPESFELPFGGKLASDNRWVVLAEIIPWSKFESVIHH